MSNDDPKIVGLKGQYVPGSGKPHGDCVDLLECLLEEAQAGQIHAVAVVCDYHDGVRFAVVGSAMGYDMIGGIEQMKRAVQQKVG